MKKSELARFREVVANLRVLCPTQHPVRVVRAALRDSDFGDAEYITKGKKHYRIRLNNTLSLDFLIWVLVHEWAHCMTWDVTHQRHLDHGPHFGVAYAEAYRAAYE